MGMDDALRDRVGDMLESVALIALEHIFLRRIVPIGTQSGKYQRRDDVKRQKRIE